MDSGSLDDIMNNPYVFGFNIGIGPDGKPSFGQFGNIKPKPYGDIEATDVREPLIDVFKENDKVRVIAEVPGINKGDIKLSGSERTLTIKAHSQSRKYEKSVSLPVAVLINTAKAKYKNGVLEVIIEVKEDKKKKKDYKIEVEWRELNPLHTSNHKRILFGISAEIICPTCKSTKYLPSKRLLTGVVGSIVTVASLITVL